MPRVLVVEDDPSVRLLVRAILEDEGHEVAEAASGFDALAAVEEEAPDLILLDLMMPGMDGWRFLEALRLRGIRERVRVVIVSALDDDETIDRGRREGALAHLAKPFDEATLLATVEEALRHEPGDLARRRERLGELVRVLRILDGLGSAQPGAAQPSPARPRGGTRA